LPFSTCGADAIHDDDEIILTYRIRGQASRLIDRLDPHTDPVDVYFETNLAALSGVVSTV